MPFNVASTQIPDFAVTFAQAIAAGDNRQITRPASSTLITALLAAEKAAKQERRVYPFDALFGKWQLCFSSGARKQRGGGISLGKGFYVPQFVTASLSFSLTAEQAEIANQLQLGAFLLKLTGPCRYLDKKNLLAFDFTQMQVSVLGRTVYTSEIRGGNKQAQEFSERAIDTLPFFAFFWITEDLIAARGRGGGLALWKRS
jgi:hypothetical protein